MRRLTVYLATTTLAVGGISFVVRADDPAAPANNPNTPAAANTPAPADSPNAAAPSDAANLNATYSSKDTSNAALPAPDADAIRKMMAKVTEDAFTKGDFYKIARNFVDADDTRIKEYKSGDKFAKLDGRIDEFNKDWKAKYGQEFSFAGSAKDVLNDSFAKVTQGEIGEARTAAGKEAASDQPQNVKGGTAEDLKKSGVNQTDANSNKEFGGGTNREAGRNIATAAIMPASSASGTDPEMNKELDVPLIHEVTSGWHIDVPDNVDGQMLENHLLNCLTKFDEDKANWPSDVNEAYRLATRHVMGAIMKTTD